MPHSAVNVRELKFGKSFDLVDTEHGGVTTLEDWEEFAFYMCSQFYEPIDSLTGNQVREAVLSWWYGSSGRIDDRRLTRTEFTAYYGNCTEAELSAVIHQYIDAVFALCDGDADGRLSRREFAGVLRVHGVPEHELTQTIQHMISDDSEIPKKKYTGLRKVTSTHSSTHCANVHARSFAIKP